MSPDYPGLVRVIDVFVSHAPHCAGMADPTDAEHGDPSSPVPMHRYVIMKLVEGLTLQEWLHEHPDEPLLSRLRQLSAVASALDGMHSGRKPGMPVAHGDVKPGNIIIREDKPSVLVDLGLTQTVDTTGRVGRSLPYAAPEIFQPGASLTPATDRFAFIRHRCPRGPG